MVIAYARFNTTNYITFCSGISALGCWLKTCPYGREQTKIRVQTGLWYTPVLAHTTNSLKEKNTYNILQLLLTPLLA